MRLVAAAKVRRAQAAVLQSRPFCETLATILYKLKEKLEFEDISNPLLIPREVKNVALVVISGERGLCGAYNSRVVKKTENRIAELRS
jgi:F-type H+-transporting ATPase subunit gamma